MAKDPVCGMDVDEKKPAATSVYQGKTYFFCALSCKATFVKAPEKYVTAEKAGRKDARKGGTDVGARRTWKGGE